MHVEAKICGITRTDDARFAVEHGAWRIGVIFAGGPRVVSVEQARRLVDAAAGTVVIGVFAGQSAERIVATAAEAGLGGVQLHGEFTAAEIERIRAADLEVWRVVPIRDSASTPNRIQSACVDADAVVIEADVPTGAGGKGIRIDSSLARLARDACTRRFVLAGGLSPDNVSEAIRAVRPDVVDVSSGVEIAPGIKDPARVTSFLEQVIGARTSA